jgi:hypothetical protein
VGIDDGDGVRLAVGLILMLREVVSIVCDAAGTFVCVIVGVRRVPMVVIRAR